MNFIQNTPIFNKINIPNVQFRSASVTYSPSFEPAHDSFSTNPITDRNTLIQVAKTNPRIKELLSEYKIPIKINEKELEKLQKNHLMDTRITAAKMYSALPENLQSEVNLKDLQDAAMFHDYGKALIPENILNKQGKLTDREKEIMDLHSELGYELLKGVYGLSSAPSPGGRVGVGVSQNALNLVKYHHQTPDGKGYPAITDDFKPDISSQILAAADKYSALREVRSYKSAMSRDEALDIIEEDVQAGTISPEVYNALEKSV